jgi:hypothetical protein
MWNPAFFIAPSPSCQQKKRIDYPTSHVVMRRDMEYFLVLYFLAIISTFLTHPIFKVVMHLPLPFLRRLRIEA